MNTERDFIWKESIFIGKMDNKRHKTYIIAAAASVLIMMILISFAIGRYPIRISELLHVISARLQYYFSGMELPDIKMDTVVFSIRMPRILLACLVGCSLSAAGAAYQGVFQNPMASPDILGASQGAAFGAAIAILLHASSRVVTISAFCFSILAVALVLLIGENVRGNKILSLILAGIMISSLFQAGTSFVKLVADPSNQLPEITYWLMGSLSGARMNDIRFVIVPMLLGWLPLLLLRWRINVLTLGDEEARVMGVNVKLVRLIVILSSTLLTAASVSVSGMIGWVGLVIPHLARKVVGNDYQYLFPASMLFGAVFMLLVDNVSRNLLAVEIPIGILTAVIGTPFFLYLITRKEEI